MELDYNRMQPTFQRFPQLGRGTEANPYCRRICVQKQKHKYKNCLGLPPSGHAENGRKNKLENHRKVLSWNLS